MGVREVTPWPPSSARWPAQQPSPGGGTAERRRAGSGLRPWRGGVAPGRSSGCGTRVRRRAGAWSSALGPARLPMSRRAAPALTHPIAIFLGLALPKAFQGGCSTHPRCRCQDGYRRPPLAAGPPDLSSTPTSTAIVPHSSPLFHAMPFAAHRCQHATAGGELVLLSSPLSSEEKTMEASTDLGHTVSIGKRSK
ncbi:unnamed protein product [Urochloa humidicola]